MPADSLPVAVPGCDMQPKALAWQPSLHLCIDLNLQYVFAVRLSAEASQSSHQTASSLMHVGISNAAVLAPFNLDYLDPADATRNVLRDTACTRLAYRRLLGENVALHS